MPSAFCRYFPLPEQFSALVIYAQRRPGRPTGPAGLDAGHAWKGRAGFGGNSGGGGHVHL